MRPSLMSYRASDSWWPLLESLGITLLVTREYEHLLIALAVVDGRPRVSYLPLPHPSGIAVDRVSQLVHVASTRNPNQVFQLASPTGFLDRERVRPSSDPRVLVPVASRFLAGAFYLHDLAFVSGRLYANAVGMNSVVDLSDGERLSWWPECIDDPAGPRHERNYLQLNSIAAGPTLSASYFSASAAAISRRRPGHRDFPVDGRGVIFDGATRRPVLTGLTRPHSARLHGDRLWVDNSGYGELVSWGLSGEDGSYDVVCRLPGWTRGLSFFGDIAFVGTSRVIPKYRQYAPGVSETDSVCGLHMVDRKSGRIRGSLIWPGGNQIFGIDWLPTEACVGLPFRWPRGHSRGLEADLFYTFTTQPSGLRR